MNKRNEKFRISKRYSGFVMDKTDLPRICNSNQIVKNMISNQELVDKTKTLTRYTIDKPTGMELTNYNKMLRNLTDNGCNYIKNSECVCNKYPEYINVDYTYLIS